MSDVTVEREKRLLRFVADTHEHAVRLGDAGLIRLLDELHADLLTLGTLEDDE